MSAYKSYMDRQSVSSDLHRQLLELDSQVPKMQKPIPWGRYLALAACLCIVVGLGWFVWAMLGFDGMDVAFVSEDSSTAVMEEAAEDTAVEEDAGEEFWDSAESAAEESCEVTSGTDEPAEDSVASDVVEEAEVVTEDSAEEEVSTEDAPWIIPGWLPDGYSLTESAETEDGYTLLWTDGEGDEGNLTLTWHETAENCPETALSGEELAETDWTEAVQKGADGVSSLTLLYRDGWLELTFIDGELLWKIGNSLWS